jgi:predicted TIM-barrel fold metal-dependent hydrolase
MLPCSAFIEIVANNEKVSPFKWRNEENRPSCRDKVTHIELLDKNSIPFIVDMHAHFFPEIATRAIWRWFDKVNWEIAYRTSLEKRLESLSKNKIKYFTTLNYAHKVDMAEWLNKWVYENYKNWEIAIPFGTFYPEKKVFDYTRKAVEEFGFKGFKLHCEVSKLNLNFRELNSTFQYLERNKIPITIHTGTAPLPGEFSGIKYFKPFIETFPELKVIIAHMGTHEVEEYISLFDSYPNLGMDTTMVFVDFFATGDETDKYLPFVEKYNSRIYFGSDFPNIPYNLSHAIENLLNSNLSNAAKKNIFFNNALRLFSLEDS